MSEEIVPAAVFYATVTPLFIWFVLKKTVIEPMNAEQKQRKIDKIKEANKQRYVGGVLYYLVFDFNTFFFFLLLLYRLAEKKREAEAAIDLLSAQYERICSEETARKGLIIVCAKYGKMSATSANNSHGM